MNEATKRRFSQRLAATVVVAGLALLGWVFAFLPGRVSWLHYSLPADAVRNGDELLLPVPCAAADGTQWTVKTMPGTSAGEDEYRLAVVRWLSTSTILVGEEIAVEGDTYRYLGVRHSANGGFVIVLQRLRPTMWAGLLQVYSASGCE